MKTYRFYYIVPLLALYYFAKKFISVHLLNSKNPANIVEIIQLHTNTCETHQVQTEDGYILTFFQIPRTNPKGVILLQHPIFFDARVWVSQYNDSIAFFFWKAGYEVWLGNTRGNFFCKEHATFAPTEPAFWNFSFHEMGYYDHHATIEYIRRNTSQEEIILVGYSMSGTSALVYASMRPEDASRSIKFMTLIAPVTHMSIGTWFNKYLLPPAFFLQRIFNIVDLNFTIMRYDVWYLRLFRCLFSLFPCRKCVIFFLGTFDGCSSDEKDISLVDDMVQVFGSEIPIKLLDHYNQMYMSGGEFRMYDYGEEGNLKMYGDKKPHFYPLGKIQVPTFLIYAQNDSLSSPENNEYLYSLLPESSTRGKLMVENFNHLDFSHGRNRIGKVYKEVLKLLEKI